MLRSKQNLVSTGRRLVFVYDLVHTSSDSPVLAASSNSIIEQLGGIFSQWQDNIRTVFDIPKTLVCLFEHQYINADLCYDALKDSDRKIVKSMTFRYILRALNNGPVVPVDLALDLTGTLGGIMR